MWKYGNETGYIRLNKPVSTSANKGHSVGPGQRRPESGENIQELTTLLLQQRLRDSWWKNFRTKLLESQPLW